MSTEDARRARDAAMDQVDAAASDEWKKQAALSIARLARSGAEFSSDDIWDDLAHHGVPAPREPRALGPIITRAIRAGYIVNVRFEKSRLPVRHCRPVAVYRKADLHAYNQKGA